MALTYLRSSPASAMVVEVDWVQGRAPSGSALGHLQSIMNRELEKPRGILIRQGNEIRSSRTSWSLADLKALERDNRSVHSSGSTATLWVAYVGGSFADNTGALGVSYSASSFVIFRDRMNEAATALILAEEIERSVLVHETGHLLSLVEIGYRSHTNRQDPDHPYHSRNRGSVMYWAVEDVSLRNLLAGGPPDDFDAADRGDLAMLREG
jgi:hypothetical protein